MTDPARRCVIVGMLGRLQRTTRLDVGLALSFAGVAYLVWALVAGVARSVVQAMIHATATQAQLPAWTRAVKIFFVDFGFVIDVVGLVWLVVSLILLVVSSRQRISVSWAWISAICQSFVAALGAVFVGWAAYRPHIISSEGTGAAASLGEQVSTISLPLIVALAVLVWVTVLIWLLVERARLNRRGPTLRDGLRTQVYR